MAPSSQARVSHKSQSYTRAAGALTLLVAFTAWQRGSTVRAQCTLSKLTASDAAAQDSFGLGVAIDGDTIFVGAPGDAGGFTDGAGSGYVFRRFGSQWTQTQKLVPPSASAGDFFGERVAISGGTLLLASRQDAVFPSIYDGSVWVYFFNGVEWVERQQLTESPSVARGHFGVSAAIHGSVIAVGAVREMFAEANEAGAVFVFRPQGGVWTQEQKLVGSSPLAGDGFGYSVSVDVNQIAVGAPANTPHGAAYVFRWNGASWVQEQKLVPSGPDPAEVFGRSVAILGDTLLVGADDNGTPSFGPGAAYVFERVNGVWIQVQILTGSTAQPGHAFGESVALTTGRSLIGSPGTDEKGAAFLFELDEGGWSEVEQLSDPLGVIGDGLGRAVGLSEEFAVIGAPGDNRAHVCEFPVPPSEIPAISPIALGIMGITLLVAGGVVLRRRARNAEPS